MPASPSPVGATPGYYYWSEPSDAPQPACFVRMRGNLPPVGVASVGRESMTTFSLLLDVPFLLFFIRSTFPVLRMQYPIKCVYTCPNPGNQFRSQTSADPKQRRRPRGAVPATATATATLTAKRLVSCQPFSHSAFVVWQAVVNRINQVCVNVSKHQLSDVKLTTLIVIIIVP